MTRRKKCEELFLVSCSFLKQDLNKYLVFAEKNHYNVYIKLLLGFFARFYLNLFQSYLVIKLNLSDQLLRLFNYFKKYDFTADLGVCIEV